MEEGVDTLKSDGDAAKPSEEAPPLNTDVAQNPPKVVVTMVQSVVDKPKSDGDATKPSEETPPMNTDVAQNPDGSPCEKAKDCGAEEQTPLSKKNSETSKSSSSSSEDLGEPVWKPFSLRQSLESINSLLEGYKQEKQEEDDEEDEDFSEQVSEQDFRVTFAEAGASQSGQDKPGRLKRRVRRESVSEGEKYRDLILETKNKINDRMEAKIKAWEKHNGYKLNQRGDERPQSAFESLYPSGFGPFVSTDYLYSAQKEPELSRLYDVIVGLKDEETKDRLLCFLDDFRIKRDVLMRLKNDREMLMESLLEWIQNVEALHVDSDMTGTLENEPGLKAEYYNTLTQMYRLMELKSEIGYISPEQKLKAKVEEVKANYYSDLMDHPLARDMSRLLNQLTTEANQFEVSLIIDRIEGVMAMLIIHDNSITRVTEKLESRRAAMEELRAKQQEHEERTAALKERKKELDHAEEVLKKKSSVLRRKHSIYSKRDMFTQTDSAITDTSSESSRSGPVRKKTDGRAPNDFSSNALPEDSTSEVGSQYDASHSDLQSEDDVSHNAKPQDSDGHLSRPISGTATPTSAASLEEVSDEGSEYVDPIMNQEFEEMQKKVRKGALMEFAKQSTADQPSAEDIQAMRKEYEMNRAKRRSTMHRSRKSLFGEREGSSIMKSVHAGELKDTQADLDEAQIEEEEPERLLTMARTFNESIFQHVDSLLERLLILREKARQELENINAKEEKLQTLTTQIVPLMKTFKDSMQALPRVHFEKNQVDVENLKPLPHTCRFCRCNLSDETVVLDTDQTARAVGLTLEHCSRYTKVLNKLKERYVSIMQGLDKIHKLADKKLKSLKVKSKETGKKKSTVKYNSSEKAADPTIQESLDSVKAMPSSNMNEVLKQTRAITESIVSIQRAILEQNRSASARLSSMQEHNELLDQMETQFDEAERLLIDSALEMAKCRCRKDFLVTGKTLHHSRCHHCDCYMKPFNDELLNMKEAGTSQEKLAKALLRAVSYTKQGIEATVALARCEDHEFTFKTFATCVEPEVFELIEDAESSILKGLEIIAPKLPQPQPKQKKK